jgi:hypothetical protein
MKEDNQYKMFADNRQDLFFSTEALIKVKIQLPGRKELQVGENSTSWKKRIAGRYSTVFMMKW